MRGGLLRDVFMSIAVSEFLVMTELSFVAAASSGVLFKSKIDDGILTYEAGLVPLPVGFLEQVCADIFMSILNETDFDMVRALLAFTRVTEIDWRR